MAPNMYLQQASFRVQMRLLLRVGCIAFSGLQAVPGAADDVVIDSKAAEPWEYIGFPSVFSAPIERTKPLSGDVKQEPLRIQEKEFPSDFCINTLITAPDPNSYGAKPPVKALALIGGYPSDEGGMGQCDYLMIAFIKGNGLAMGVQCNGQDSQPPVGTQQTLTHKTTHAIQWCYIKSKGEAKIFIDGNLAVSAKRKWEFHRRGQITFLAGTHDRDTEPMFEQGNGAYLHEFHIAPATQKSVAAIKPPTPETDVSAPTTDTTAATPDRNVAIPEGPGATTLSAGSSSGGKALTVKSNEGFTAGDVLIIDRGGSIEEVAVVQGVGPAAGVLTLETELKFQHDVGAEVLTEAVWKAATGSTDPYDSAGSTAPAGGDQAQSGTTAGVIQGQDAGGTADTSQSTATTDGTTADGTADTGQSTPTTITTCGGAPEPGGEAADSKAPCIIPFIYAGVTKNTCISDTKQEPWCYTNVDTGTWGYCNCNACSTYVKESSGATSDETSCPPSRCSWNAATSTCEDKAAAPSAT
jgi:hypothetical protein